MNVRRIHNMAIIENAKNKERQSYLDKIKKHNFKLFYKKLF